MPIPYRLLIGHLLLVSTLLTGCNSTTLINAFTPRNAFTLQKDIAYGNDQRQKMDIYIPTRKPPRSAIVVFVHGGSWADGDKQQYLFVGQAFTEMGYTTVIPNYRLYPKALFPDFVDDIAKALGHIKSVINTNCLDASRVILVGHSAGAHSVAMIATAPTYLQHHNADNILAAWIGLAGPYDLPLDNPLVVDKFTTVKNNFDANPLKLANAKTPPALLIHGDKDTTVYPHHTHDMNKRLQELKVPVTTHFYPGMNHTKLLGGLAKRLRLLNPLYDDIAAYLSAQGLDTQCSLPINGRVD